MKKTIVVFLTLSYILPFNAQAELVEHQLPPVDLPNGDSQGYTQEPRMQRADVSKARKRGTPIKVRNKSNKTITATFAESDELFDLRPNQSFSTTPEHTSMIITDKKTGETTTIDIQDKAELSVILDKDGSITVK